MKSIQHNNIKKIQLITFIALSVLTVLGFFAIMNRTNSDAVQSMRASAIVIDFEGEYKIGDGSWREYHKGVHIPSNKGDVSLRGHFCFENNNMEKQLATGSPLCFKMNHIGGKIYHNGNLAFMFDCENEYLGNISCANMWSGNYRYTLTEADELFLHKKATGSTCRSMEHRRFELLTPTLPVLCATNCANAPCLST